MLNVDVGTKFNRLTEKMIAIWLIMCIFISNSMPILTNISKAESEESDVNIDIEIEKYIQYKYSEDDSGIIIQSKIKVNKEIENVKREEITVTVPTYQDIKPDTIKINLKNGNELEEVTQKDESKFSYFVNQDKTEITIVEPENMEQEYYITYYYSKEAYDKYLDTTHVKEYPYGKILSIEKDEETGNVYANIDFEWDEEENAGKDKPDSRVLVDKVKINQKVKAILTDEDNNIIEKEEDKTDEVVLQIGSIIDINTNINPNEIKKGLLYAKKEVNLKEENTLSLLRHDKAQIVNIDDLREKFLDEEDKGTLLKENYTSFSISKENFEKMLGQDGYIKLLDESKNEITKIDSTIEADENGNYVFNYPEGVEKVNIEISGIQDDGFLKYTQSKVILKDQEYSKEELMKYKKLRSSCTIEKIEDYTQEIEKNVEIDLTESYTNASLSINNVNLSTIYENTGIEFKIELKNNNEDTDLWENPFFVISMPEEVEQIDINGSSLLYGDNLELAKTNIIDVYGKKAIYVQLKGSQNDFVSSSIDGGTTILINADIKLKDLTLTSKDNMIGLYYFNNNKTNYETEAELVLDKKYNLGYSSLLVNYVAPVEFKTIQQISNFNDDGSIVNSDNSEKQTGKIQILDKEKDANYKIILMNNTGNTVTKIQAIGKIPFVGNTDIETNDDLGTTINASISKNITVENNKEALIYYSENENPSTDIEKVENGWTISPENMNNIKTYMIVINEMKQGEKVFLNYNVKIPANLEHGESLYSSLVTYYTVNTEVGEYIETSKANTVGLSTGIGARAKIELENGIDAGGILTEGQKVKYKIKVQNTGSIPAENVVVRNPIPKGTTYIEETVVKNDIETFNKYTYYTSENELRWEIGSIDVGQTAELEYTVVIDNVPSILEYYGMQEGFTEEDGRYYIVSKDETTGQEIKTEISDLPDVVIKNSAILESSSIEKEIVSNEVQNSVAKSYFDIQEECSVEKAVIIEEKQEYSYVIIVENKTDLNMKNLKVTKTIPDGVTYKNTEILQGNGNISYDENNKKLNISSDSFAKEEIIEIRVTVVANQLPEGVYKKDVVTNSQVSAEGITANTSSSVINTIGKSLLSASIECDVKQRYIYEKDMLNYTITIKNDNDVTASNLTITDIIPEGTKFVTGSYIQNGNEYTILSDGSNNIEVNTNLGNGTIVLKIKVQVEKITANVEELELINKATYKSNTIDEKEIGQIKHTVIKTSTPNDNSGSDDNGSNNGKDDRPGGGEIGEDGVTRYKIKGSVWEDANKDGQRQDDEKTISDVKVYLLKENGDIAKDYKTGEEKIAVSNENGEYEFNNVEKGKYIVIFMYDNNTYNITEYQKNGVVNDRNSDAILKTVYVNGNSQEAGVTDLIEVTNRNMYSIDLGLTLKAKFNLKLDAGISSITVNTKEGLKKTEYNMANLAKAEIRSSLINGATVIIEYTLKITNDSDLPGSVLQLMGSKNGLTFNSNANNNWYEGNDNNIYISSLSNEIINPGESKEVKLTLIKQMTNNNSGQIDNNFTITKTYNEKGQIETTLEDNSKIVTCLISTSTGTAAKYTGIAILVLVGIIGVSVITKKKFRVEKRWI